MKLQERGSDMVYVTVAGVIFLLDSVIKFLVEHLADGRKRVPVFGGKMYLTKYHNKGAFLNFGESRRVAVRYVSLALTAGCFVVFVVTLGRKGKGLLKLGLSMMLGGAFSNTYDRMARGYVVDYAGFSSKWKRFSDIAFNISDFCIIIGAMLSALSGAEKKPETAKAATAASGKTDRESPAS